MPSIGHAAEPAWYVNGNRATSEAGARIDGTIESQDSGTDGFALSSPVVGEIVCTRVVLSGTTNAIGGSGGFFTVGCVSKQLQAPALVTAELPPEGARVKGEVCNAAGKWPSQCPAATERKTVLVVPQKGDLREGLPRRADAAWTQSLSYGEWEEEEENVLDRVGNPVAPSTETCTPASQKWTDVADGCIKLNVVIPLTGVEEVIYGTLVGGIIDGVRNGLSPSRLQLFSSHVSLPRTSGVLQSNEDSLGDVSIDAEIVIHGEGGMELITAK